MTNGAKLDACRHHTGYSPTMSRSLSESFAIPNAPQSDSDDDDVTSLPSTSTESFESYDDYDAQLEWERSLQQLELLLTMVLVPFVGKYLGRKFAFWSMLLHPIRLAIFTSR